MLDDEVVEADFTVEVYPAKFRNGWRWRVKYNNGKRGPNGGEVFRNKFYALENIQFLFGGLGTFRVEVKE